MHILMLAPEPFFEPRGTPFSEYHRIRALLDLGHTIDLVTYPFGADVSLPGLRIIRSARPPFVQRVSVGPSLMKVVLDGLLAWRAWRLARHGGYDVVHSHEEAGLLGLWLARRFRLPHVYDMHSSLPQQLANFGYSRSRVIRSVFEAAERRMVEHSEVIITICQELQDLVVRMGAGARAVLIENVCGGDFDEPSPRRSRASLRAEYGIGADDPLVLYTGTFETYQGLDLLVRATALLQRTHPRARVMVVGGTPEQVEDVRGRAQRIGAAIAFTGQRPPGEIPDFVAAADVLVSPRISGTNTPLKIYSYLRSHRPIVATDLPTHTQVLSPRWAVLVPPEPEPFARALARLIDDPAERARLAETAAGVAASRYSREVFLARTREAYRRVTPSPGIGIPDSGVVGVENRSIPAHREPQESPPRRSALRRSSQGFGFEPAAAEGGRIPSSESRLL